MNEPLSPDQPIPTETPHSTDIVNTHEMLHAPLSKGDKVQSATVHSYSEFLAPKIKYVAFLEKKKPACRIKV